MYVQHGLLLTQILMISFHERINKELEFLPKYIYYIIVSIPLLVITYMDVVHSSFGFKMLGIPESFNKIINKLLIILGSYSMIQILAQDSGLKTGIVQRDTIQTGLLFGLASLGMAYTTSNNRSFSMIAVLLYFHMKYVISNNKTTQVCFEDV